MSDAAVQFPEVQPEGYTWFENEPTFNPAKHLDLEMPERIQYLEAFGYGSEEIKSKASPVAVSSPFRVLSEEGAQVLLETARALRQHAISCERIENMVRGGCYRSRFLRDLCVDPSLTQLMCDIYETDVAPHTMPLHLGHMNFSPDDLSKAVDKWHHDTLPLDIVMMVTDPKSLDGGQFEYFVGTKNEMADLAAQGLTPPIDRIEAPPFHGPGYAIALHGDMVVHRGAPLNTAGERISMVNGYVSTNCALDDQHRHKDLTLVDDPVVLYAEWAKHSAWRAKQRLDELVNTMQFNPNSDAIADELELAISDVTKTIAEMRDKGEHDMHHYEKS